MAVTSSTVPGGTVLRITTAWNGPRRRGGFERLYEVLHDAVDVSEVGFAARRGRRANAQERRVGVLQRIDRADVACRFPDEMAAGKQGFQTRLNDGTVAGRDGRNLQFVRIDAPDVMAVGGQTSGRDGADIAEAKDRDLHALKEAGAAEDP